MSDRALVVLVDGKQSVSLYLTAETCLNHAMRLAAFFGKEMQIALFFGHTDAKWKGRGLR